MKQSSDHFPHLEERIQDILAEEDHNAGSVAIWPLLCMLLLVGFTLAADIAAIMIAGQFEGTADVCSSMSLDEYLFITAVITFYCDCVGVLLLIGIYFGLPFLMDRSSFEELRTCGLFILVIITVCIGLIRLVLFIIGIIIMSECNEDFNLLRTMMVAYLAITALTLCGGWGISLAMFNGRFEKKIRKLRISQV